MQFKIQMIIQDEHGETKTEDIITLDKPGDKMRDVGVSLQESQGLLKALQKTIICHQITFLSDGADNVRNLQYNMYPESEQLLDWFHVTMRLTVLTK